ncbi:TonB-dependent receptor [Saprospira sp. CCB-QB6]|uniref:TonB-dependent receptor domain-containing protein n=1 Tax=Saprospira sp. CCB-QB6 TaxID=3023936 RepID=UPI0023496A71|nr:TonB-dependent receptor [Saprospira sp. CCB-QB6]WCL80416.1 TonB-dependent receptor [Saprospira sp. CCB-QB6]
MKLTLLPIFLLYCVWSWAQGPMPPAQTTVLGQLVDTENKKPLEFATVSLYNLSDSLITGGITDMDGNFRIPGLPYGDYYAKLNFMGYEEKRIDSLRLELPTLNLGQILLKPDAATQETVQITANKSLLKLGLDKKVFDVENSGLGNSESATEVLRSTPGIEVDQDEQIKVRGKVVQVYINGKPTGLTGENQAAVLRQLPANSIKSVEIITSPSAKDAPDGGAGGIINIVMKRNLLSGFTGNVNARIGTNARGWRSEPVGPMFNKFNTGLGLNYKSEKLNLFSNVSWNRRGSYTLSEAYRFNQLPDSSYYFNTYRDSRRKNDNFWGRLGMDYYISPTQTLSMQVRGGAGSGLNTGQTQYDNFGQDSVFYSQEIRGRDGDAQDYNWSYNAVYSIIFPEKDSTGKPNLDKIGGMGDQHELVFDFQISNSQDQDVDYYGNQSYWPNGDAFTTAPDSQRIEDFDSRREIWARIDYTLPLPKLEGRLELGYHYRYQLDRSDFGYYNYVPQLPSLVNDSSRSNIFEYEQQIHALYGTYSQKFGKKWSGKFGLRLEQASVDPRLISTNESYPWDYFQLFPSLNLGYQMSKSAQMTFNYSRRIDRPGSWSTNPFPSFEDPRYLYYGNPYLQPSFTDKVELNYGNYVGQSGINIGLYASYNDNESTRVQTIDSLTGVIRSRPQNLAYNYQYGLDFNFNTSIFSWWTINLGGNLYQSHFDAEVEGQDLSYQTLGSSGNIFSSIRLQKIGLNISMGGSVWYQVRDIQGSNRPNFWHWVSVNKQLMDKKLRLSLWVQNPIYSNSYRYQRSTDSFRQSGIYEWENRVINFSMSYNFGKMNVKNKRRSQLENRSGGGDGGSGGQGGI